MKWLCELLGARDAARGERLQSLWSGYGEIYRVRLTGAAVASVIVKEVRPPAAGRHPLGWNTDRSHQRKLRSYAVERAWYEGPAARCDAACRVPRFHGSREESGALWIVLEDLDAAGFPARRARVTRDELDLGLRWLASFHATFAGRVPEGLWEVGTYWHLATRPDELAAMTDEALRAAAPAIDARLGATAFPTLVHGDAKLANFCFSPDGTAVAAVDFQYVGAGTGMKDLVYFLSSSLSSDEQEASAAALVDRYFALLREALARTGAPVDAVALEMDWRALYPWAWADFCRFLDGWAPGQRHLDRHGWRVTRDLLARLGSE